MLTSSCGSNDEQAYVIVMHASCARHRPPNLCFVLYIDNDTKQCMSCIHVPVFKDCRYSFMKNFPIIDFIQTLCMSRT